MQSALTPLKLIGEMVPFATKMVPLSVSEEQPPTLMIEGVLAKLASKVEATEARGDGEEEGSSSTIGKDGKDDK